MSKVIFRKILFYPFILKENKYGGEFVVLQLGPDIRNNSRNKNTENNSATLLVRGTGEKPRTERE